jgi:hypothetical protein
MIGVPNELYQSKVYWGKALAQESRGDVFVGSLVSGIAEFEA